MRLRKQILSIGDVATTNWSLQDTVVYNQSTKAKPIYPKYNFQFPKIIATVSFAQRTLLYFSLSDRFISFSLNTPTHLSLSLFFSHASFIFTHFLALSVPNFPENLLPPRTPLVLVSLDRPLGSDSLFISINALHLNLTELSWAFGILDMENGAVQNGVCSSESVNGCCDVWSCKDSDSSSAYHLVVMVNGILGRSGSNSCLILIFQIFRIYNFTWICCFWFWFCLMIA